MKNIMRWIGHQISWNYSDYLFKQMRKHVGHDLILTDDTIRVTLECLTCSAHLNDWYDSKGIHEYSVKEEKKEQKAARKAARNV